MKYIFVSIYNANTEYKQLQVPSEFNSLIINTTHVKHIVLARDLNLFFD